MPHTLPSQKLFAALVAFAIGLGMVLLIAERSEAAPPVDEIIWSNEMCSNDLGSVTLTVTGKGRWATVLVEVSTDGGSSFASLGPLYDPYRIEHGWHGSLAWPVADQFRAMDVKHNGSPIGEWVYSDQVDC